MSKYLVLPLILICFSCTSIESSDKLVLKSNDREILTYNAAFQPSPDREKPWFGRSGFIDPVFSPKGIRLTDPFPADHLHQHAIMFAWTSSRIGERKVDFWNSKKLEGRVEHLETIAVSNSKIIVKLQHIDLKGGGQVAINETWEISRVYHPSLNIFDLKSIQSSPLKDGVKISKYHYGALCMRTVLGLKAITSEGKDKMTGNHSRPDWVAYSGKIGNDECGLAAIQHKSNFRYPQPVRINPKYPYFCFAPMVLGDFKLEYQKDYISKFRFVAFDGKLNKSAIDKAAADFNKD